MVFLVCCHYCHYYHSIAALSVLHTGLKNLACIFLLTAFVSPVLTVSPLEIAPTVFCLKMPRPKGKMLERVQLSQSLKSMQASLKSGHRPSLLCLCVWSCQRSNKSSCTAHSTGSRKMKKPPDQTHSVKLKCPRSVSSLERRVLVLLVCGTPLSLQSDPSDRSE